LQRCADASGCRQQRLVAYFDETMEPCGASCDHCRGKTFVDLVGHPVARASAPRGAIVFAEADGELFQRLRALRRSLADDEGVPAYVVFSDAVLASMAAMKPTDEAGFLAVPGVGPAKLSRYGAAFLRLLRDA